MSETQPMLPSGQRRSSRTSSGAGRRASRLVAPRSEIHPSPNDDSPEPLLPAQAVPDATETDLHETGWAEYEGRPNLWARFRHTYKEELAECLGTSFILLFGAGVECQTRLHGSTYGDYNSGRLAWATGVALAVWLAGGVSGAHCNPSVTIALAVFRGFPAGKVLPYIVAQVIGATIGSLVIYANYAHSITMFDGGIRQVTGHRSTAGLFFTFPSPGLPYGTAFLTEFTASAVLLIAVFALSDRNNLSPPRGIMPIAMFITLIGIGAALGHNTGYAINGARDTGPRLALWLVGYGSEVWTNNRFYAVWNPWLSSILGALFGSAIYDALIYTGRDSPINRPVNGKENPLINEEAVDDDYGGP